METKKQKLKRLKQAFNKECLERDNFCCVFCKEKQELNVHHIIDRHDLENMGYTKWNGITLCSMHHWKAEQYHISKGKEWVEEFHPEDLFKKINSSKEKAIEESQKL